MSGDPEGTDGAGAPDGSRGSEARRPTAVVERFYGRWAAVYDPVARYFPRVRAVRQAVADACRLEPGDTVVEMGCGTGANVPFLRERVAPGGRVVGVDVTGPALRRARRRSRTAQSGVESDGVAASDDVAASDGVAASDDVAASDGVAVEFVRADARDPPVTGSVDAVVGTFVSGMFPSPAAVVDRWCDRAEYVVLADAAPSERPAARPLNALFRAATVVSTPPTTRLRYERDLLDRLTERVETAHDRLRERSSAVAEARFLFGFVRLTGGRVDVGDGSHRAAGTDGDADVDGGAGAGAGTDGV